MSVVLKNVSPKKDIIIKAKTDANDAMDVFRINVDELSLMVLATIFKILYKIDKIHNKPINP